MTGAAADPSVRRDLDAVIDGSPIGVALTDADGRVLRANAALGELLGRAPAEIERQRWHDLVAAEDRAGVEALDDDLTAGGRDPLQVLQRWPRDDGSLALTTVTVTAVRDGTGALSGRVLHVQAVEGRANLAGRWRDAGPALAGAAMQEAAAALADAVTIEQITAVMEQQVLAAFGADGLLIALVEGPRLHLVTSRGYVRAAQVALSDLPLDDPAPMVEVVRRRVPRFFESRQEYLSTYPSRAELATVTGKQAWAFLPLVAGGRAIGSLTLSFDAARPFSIAERALLIALSGLVAQAVARAQVLDAERSLARALQGSLLPAEMPTVANAEVAVRYRPAGAGVAVGGDFYDVVHGLGVGVGVVVGDVQGHSAEAAAVMGQVRSALRAYTAEGHDPGAVVARTNRFLLTAGIETFVTCTYGRFHPDTGLLRVVRAGHVPPLRLRDGAAVLLDVAGSLPLGVADDAVFTTAELVLAPGDRLVLFTDGLVETRGASIDDGHAALSARAESAADLPLEAFADALLADHSAREDDVALLVLAYAGPAAAGDAPDRAAGGDHVASGRGAPHGRSLP